MRGNIATKLANVTAAASRSQLTRCACSKARQPWVRIARAIHGPITGSRFDHSMRSRLPGDDPGTPDRPDT